MQKAAELDEARRFGEDSAHLHVAIEHVTSEGGHVVAGRSQQARLSGKMARDHFAAAGFETTRIA